MWRIFFHIFAECKIQCADVLPIFPKKQAKKVHFFFLAINLLAPNQSGFKPGDSCINQLLSITHEIYSSFDDGFEVRSVFLDISKAFDKGWHEAII